MIVAALIPQTHTYGWSFILLHLRKTLRLLAVYVLKSSSLVSGKVICLLCSGVIFSFSLLFLEKGPEPCSSFFDREKICSKCLTFAGWECSTTTLSEPSTLRVFIDLDCFALLSHLSFRKESTNCFVFWIQSCVLSCETLVITGGAVMVCSRPIRWFQLYEHAGLFS